MAWSILSAIRKVRSLYAILTFGPRLAQIILAQVDRDSSIIHLVEVISDVYSFLKEAEPIKKIESNCRIFSFVAQQTTECAYFIRDYAMNKTFCMSVHQLHTDKSHNCIAVRAMSARKQLQLGRQYQNQTIRR